MGTFGVKLMKKSPAAAPCDFRKEVRRPAPATVISDQTHNKSSDGDEDRTPRGGPAVPEQRSGERVVPPGAAAASSPLPLNGHRVNPLKVHPSAAVTRQSGAVGVRGGQRRRRGEKRRRRRQQEAVSGKSEAAARRQSSCTKSEERI